jgi:hypothetical protein
MASLDRVECLRGIFPLCPNENQDFRDAAVVTDPKLSVVPASVPSMRQRAPFADDEKESLRVSLDRHRDLVTWKLTGWDDDQWRRRRTPSDAALLGLVKHLASVECGWFCETFGRPADNLQFDPDVPRSTCARTARVHFGHCRLLRRARAAADRVVAEVGIEDLATV